MIVSYNGQEFKNGTAQGNIIHEDGGKINYTVEATNRHGERICVEFIGRAFEEDHAERNKMATKMGKLVAKLNG